MSSIILALRVAFRVKVRVRTCFRWGKGRGPQSWSSSATALHIIHLSLFQSTPGWLNWELGGSNFEAKRGRRRRRKERRKERGKGGKLRWTCQLCRLGNRSQETAGVFSWRLQAWSRMWHWGLICVCANNVPGISQAALIIWNIEPCSWSSDIQRRRVTGYLSIRRPGYEERGKYVPLFYLFC